MWNGAMNVMGVVITHPFLEGKSSVYIARGLVPRTCRGETMDGPLINTMTGEVVRCDECGRVLFDQNTEPCGECMMFESEVALNMSGVL